MRGRLAPSPTGCLHLGNAFAFLAACADIRQKNGTLIMRVEDIDPDRSRLAYVQGMVKDLHWLGMGWQEGPGASPVSPSASPVSPSPSPVSGFLPDTEFGPFAPYVQSACGHLYTAAISRLQDMGLVYPCFCTRKDLRSLPSAPHGEDGSTIYPGLCRTLSAEEVRTRKQQGKQASLRLNVEKALAFLDTLSGREASASDQHRVPHGQLFPSAQMPLAGHDSCLFALDEAGIRSAFVKGGDFALMRSDGVVAYQLAVALDDGRMRITEVVRGNDLVASTPRQILLCRLLGYAPPRYWHVPLVCDAMGERLAKRHKSLELCALRDQGVSPGAVIGLLAHIAGFTPTLAPVTFEQFIQVFRMKGLPPALVLPEVDVVPLLRGM